MGNDRLATFRVAIAGVRGATTAAAIGLTIPEATRGHWWVVGCVAVVALYDLARLWRPLRDRVTSIDAATPSDTAALGAEIVLHLAAVVATGRWESPVAFPLLTVIVVVGFSRGFGPALRVAAASAALVGVATCLVDPLSAETGRLILQWTVEVLLVGLVAGYVRRITGEASRQHSAALDSLSRLTTANHLLSSLHEVAQSLPESFDLNDTLATTMARLRDLFAADVTAVLLHDDTSGRWVVTRADGSDTGEQFATEGLPLALRQVLLTGKASGVEDLVNRGRGLVTRSCSGAYAPLVARDATVGLLALEYQEPRAITSQQLDLLDALRAPVGLAVDNARWFERLRTIGAEEERTRIARDLHDRIGQSLAYLAFELDRIIKSHTRGNTIDASLQRLRGDVRGVIGEVRDTLYDLRTDVSATSDMASTLRAFLTRVAERSNLKIAVDSQETCRLPLMQEREMWRIAQEAVTNVERHARAERVTVRWRCEPAGAELEVIDDGIGFPAGRAGRLDSYGILGMRERAASMGATLEVDSEPGRGTRICCRVVT